jgi:hypothetical protein
LEVALIDLLGDLFEKGDEILTVHNRGSSCCCGRLLPNRRTVNGGKLGG